MSNINNSEYWAEVASVAAGIVSDAADQVIRDNGEFDRDEVLELINDSLLHGTIDGHQWVIYYAYNLDVLQHSANEDYMIDNLGLESAGESLKNGLSTLHMHLAYWALYADVQDALESALDDYESEQE